MANPGIVTRLNKLLLPLAGCLLLGGALYLEGSAYQTAGAEALESGWRVLGYALSIGLILSLATLVQRLVQYVVLDGLVASAMGGPVPRLLSQLSGLLIFLLAFGAIAGFVFKQDLTVLWAASGVAGVVLGMALRELLLDIFTGLALNLDRPVRIGDHVRLHKAGDETLQGRIVEISWRSTRLKDDMGNLVIVPNSRIAASTITNHSMPEPWLEFMVPLVLDAGVPTERALRILEAAVIEASLAFATPTAPPPYIRVRAITLNGVEYGVYFNPPVEKRFRARSIVLEHVLRHLDRAGLRPAWPKGERASGDPETAAWRSVEADGLTRLLAATAPLNALDTDDRAVLAGAIRLRRLPAGLTLVQAGETAVAVHLVLEGLLAAEPARGRGAGAAPVPLGPGRLVGAGALLLGGAHGETVRCRTETLVGEITMDTLRLVLERRPEAAEALSRAAAALLAGEGAGGRAGEADLAADILSNLRRATGLGRLVAAR
ncbi:mechanosensitive ion channel domain-containing protein [Azospirillum agricola]|uniref:mechanosensitive ion channel domain-containing protein n=1 Tax=Azospirillum agricola TaxID=1720247 RepID=UPI000A0EFEB8|nr:mechanosensitive ion channel domain-containing protein [Azospirillum agricola]SMH62636.1 Small-conductance mechanosensitive channel [Azospirillum lipoferum]